MNAGEDARACHIADAQAVPAAAWPRRRVLAAVALPWWTTSHAIDNPDAPDRNAAFLERARPYEERLSQASRASETTAASSAYGAFLEAELNQAYHALVAQIDDQGARRALVLSQREWLRFREAELRFIDENWTPKTFGTSFALSRAGYRHSLVKQRVSTLLAYLQNYAAGPVRGK